MRKVRKVRKGCECLGFDPRVVGLGVGVGRG